jgi:hypothetical protein
MDSITARVGGGGTVVDRGGLEELVGEDEVLLLLLLVMRVVGMEGLRVAKLRCRASRSCWSK